MFRYLLRIVNILVDIIHYLYDNDLYHNFAIELNYDIELKVKLTNKKNR